jgi:hypothetical protein
MDRPDYLGDDDDFQGVVKAERRKILHANRNAAQTPRSPSVSSVSGSGRRLSIVSVIAPLGLSGRKWDPRFARPLATQRQNFRSLAPR